MCGRYTLSSPGETVAEIFGLEQIPLLLPRFNIAPTQETLVVLPGAVGGKPKGELLRWGLVPSWADDPRVGGRMINARAESAASRPAYRDSLRYQRCLVPADGFYEWHGEGAGRHPYLVQRVDRLPFAFGGLWARWRRSETDPPLDTFTILTVEPNDLLRPLHDRMPLILPPAAYSTWLDRRITSPAALAPLLNPAEPDGWQAVPVSRAVNNVRHDEADCIAPLVES